MSSGSPTMESEEELMVRLQSQFGDLDLTNLLLAGNTGTTSNNKESDDESSSCAAEPTPEELRAWQEAQYQKGQAALQAKRDATKSAVQRRRECLKEEQEDDWEQVPALPQLLNQESVFFPRNEKETEILGVHPLLQQLCTQSSAADILGTPWHLLYSSAQGDGLSFLRLMAKVQGYPGPTVLLMGAIPSPSKALHSSNKTTSASTTTIGFFTTSPWTESNTMTGSSDCFLFAFQEEDSSTDNNKVHFFPPKKTNSKIKEQHYMYCHSSSTTRPKSNTDIHGLGVGGNGSSPAQLRLYLTETLEECRALDYCTLFEPGDLLLGSAQDSLNYFDVTALEVWAVGGEKWIKESLAQQAKQQAIVDANRAKARLVDKQRIWKECFESQQQQAYGGGSMLAATVQVDGSRCDV
ncbi:expressed unknown protein [Seminavis robusta]|uniref:TLDc domain-containing protein n=1 Tax=Seminavis robusta TaxID=568900 RepID=A0A9N8HRU8_9STRA|nr:expressed unknown protein [Seminavis robusta]|eukprot:Sro1106_g241970.1 n/a (409) ;mRNA; r:6751-7977